MTGNQTGASPRLGAVLGLVEVRATQVSPPPGWALLERRLMKLMEDAVEPMVDKYAEKGGAFYCADAVDDLYERVYNWGLSYAMGPIARFSTSGCSNGTQPPDFSPPTSSAASTPAPAQIHNEYYHPAGRRHTPLCSLADP